MKSDILMFSIGINRYDLKYARLINTHRKYANKYSYNYVMINRPKQRVPSSDAAWLKIPLILAGLNKGYSWIFFIDADCMIRSNTPPIQSIETKGKYVYMTLGYSGRFNSGVIIVKNSPESKLFFNRLLDESDNDNIPKEDRAPYENGHIIHYAKYYDFIQTLDRCWNNNVDKELNDYIRYYTGPLKNDFKINSTYKNKKFHEVYKIPEGSRKERLESLTNFCKNIFNI